MIHLQTFGVSMFSCLLTLLNEYIKKKKSSRIIPSDRYRSGFLRFSPFFRLLSPLYRAQLPSHCLSVCCDVCCVCSSKRQQCMCTFLAITFPLSLPLLPPPSYRPLYLSLVRQICFVGFHSCVRTPLSLSLLSLTPWVSIEKIRGVSYGKTHTVYTLYHRERAYRERPSAGTPRMLVRNRRRRLSTTLHPPFSASSTIVQGFSSLRFFTP